MGVFSFIEATKGFTEMGNFSRFKLEIEPQDKTTKRKVIRKLRKRSDYARMCLDENGESDDSATWYDYQIDLANFSKSYPDLLFIVRREGEEAGDIEKSYFKNGRKWTTRAKIVFAPFDESEMK